MNKDFFSGLFMFVGTAILTYIYGVLNTGTWDIKWSQLGLTAATATLAYIIKKLGTNTDQSKIIGISVK